MNLKKIERSLFYWLTDWLLWIMDNPVQRLWLTVVIYFYSKWVVICFASLVSRVKNHDKQAQT